MQVLLFCSISYSSSSISFRTLSVTPVPHAHASIGPQVGPPVATWTTPERAVGHCVWWPSPPDAKASASKRCHKHSTFVDGKKSCSMLILRIYQYIYTVYHVSKGFSPGGSAGFLPSAPFIGPLVAMAPHPRKPSLTQPSSRRPAARRPAHCVPAMKGEVLKQMQRLESLNSLDNLFGTIAFLVTPKTYDNL